MLDVVATATLAQAMMKNARQGEGAVVLSQGVNIELAQAVSLAGPCSLSSSP